MGWNDYRYKYEMVVKGKNKGKIKNKKSTPILYGWNGGRHYFIETRFESDVWEIKRKTSNQMVHPTQKPLELMQWCMTKLSNEGDTILDPFAGSGTTCVAAKILGRKYIGIEISPVYAAIARKRVEQAQYEERLDFCTMKVGV